MKLKLITAVAAMVASVSTIAGELDGSGLICRIGTQHIIGWEFRDGHAISWWINPKDLARRLEQYDMGEYSVSTDQVRWPPEWILDRETFRLGGENQVDNSMGPKGTMIWFHQCEVAESLDILRATVEAEEKEWPRMPKQ
jgi:hypothetical protein